MSGTATAQPLIELDGVTKAFFTDEVETHALAGISLRIDKGEYVSIAGPSGCSTRPPTAATRSTAIPSPI